MTRREVAGRAGNAMKRITCDIEKCLGCRSCELACAVEHSRSQSLPGAVLEDPLPIHRVRVLAALGKPSTGGLGRAVPLQCRQCEEPECVFACKSGALSRDPDTGIVRCDEERCVGCWMCVMVCPLGSLRRSAEKVAIKCDLCSDREEPACVRACPTGALRLDEVPPPRRAEAPAGCRGLTHVIIGASAAGVAAAEAIRESDETARVVMISEEAEALYSRPMLYLDLMKVRDDSQFRPASFFEERRIEPILGKRVEAVDPGRRSLRFAAGGSISFDRLLIATGAHPRRPEIAGIEKEGVLGFRTLADLRAMERGASKASRAVVLGGGNVGLQAACGLRERGLEVTVIVKSPHLLSQLVDAEAGGMYETRLVSHGIRVRTRTDVVEILGEKRVEGVRLDTGETLPCEMVIAAKGVVPNLDLIQGSGIDAGRGIRVDPRMETSLKGIFAAGDVAETPDVVSGRPEVHAIWPCAFEQGRIAGLNMAGVGCEYAGANWMNAAEFYGLEMISLGTVKGTGEMQEWVYRGEPDVYRKLVFSGGVLVGAVLVGAIGDAGLLRLLMRDKVDLRSLEDMLVSGARLDWLLPALRKDPVIAADPRWQALM